MSPAFQGLLVFVVIVAVIIGLVRYNRYWNEHGGGKTLREKAERRKAEREAGVRMRGWQYDGSIDGNIHYRIDGITESGHAWRIHYDSDQSSSSSSPKLIFTAAALGRAGYQWFIHDKKTYDLTQKAALRALVGGIATLVGAFSESVKAKRDIYLNAKVLPVGGQEFRERYVLAALDPCWRDVLDAELERQMLHWPGFTPSMSSRDNCFSAELVPQGLRIQLYADAPDMAVIEHMARLGQRLTDKAHTLLAD